MKRRLRRSLVAFAAVTLLSGGVLAADVLPRRASHDRTWIRAQSRLPIVRTDGDSVRISGIRDFRHAPDGTSEESWIDGEYDVSQLERVWFALSPFNPRFRGIAHPFLSFEFADGRTLAVSVEARREEGEEYSPLGGLLRRYESMVVIGTESDLLALRVIAWDDPLYLFPVRVTPAQAQHLFRRLLDDAQQIERTPTWYNTLTNNCTSTIIDAINELAAADAALGPLVGVLPGYSLEAAYERGWIDTDLSLEETRRLHYANDRIAAAHGASDFSRAIRVAPAGS
jgi:hypothetical protein